MREATRRTSHGRIENPLERSKESMTDILDLTHVWIAASAVVEPNVYEEQGTETRWSSLKSHGRTVNLPSAPKELVSETLDLKRIFAFQ